MGSILPMTCVAQAVVQMGSRGKSYEISDRQQSVAEHVAPADSHAALTAELQTVGWPLSEIISVRLGSTVAIGMRRLSATCSPSSPPPNSLQTGHSTHRGQALAASRAAASQTGYASLRVKARGVGVDGNRNARPRRRGGRERHQLCRARIDLGGHRIASRNCPGSGPAAIIRG